MKFSFGWSYPPGTSDADIEARFGGTQSVWYARFWLPASEDIWLVWAVADALNVRPLLAYGRWRFEIEIEGADGDEDAAARWLETLDQVEADYGAELRDHIEARAQIVREEL